MNLLAKLCLVWVLYWAHKEKQFVLSPLEGLLLVATVGLALGRTSRWFF